MRSLIQIYALAVCFATLMCFVVALGIAIYDAIQIAAPGFTAVYYEPYYSNDAYRQYFPNTEGKSDDEITRAREQAFDTALHAERRGAMQSAIFAFIILVIDTVVFAVHWRIAKRAQPAVEQT
jgi:hypothetical protein